MEPGGPPVVEPLILTNVSLLNTACMHEIRWHCLCFFSHHEITNDMEIGTTFKKA